MMHEEEQITPAVLEKLGGRAVLDLPLLSRDDATWTQFNGAEGVAETALRGGLINCLHLVYVVRTARSCAPAEFLQLGVP